MVAPLSASAPMKNRGLSLLSGLFNFFIRTYEWTTPGTSNRKRNQKIESQKHNLFNNFLIHIHSVNFNQTFPMLITNSTPEDIDAIFDLYNEAVKYQRTVFNKQWEGFERGLVETEIRENRQWKIVDQGQIVCIFAITFNDALIWKEKDIDPAIYIHRIVTNPKFRGGAYVKEIVKWSRDYAKSIGKKFVRMDTWGDNKKLKDYYMSCGFDYLGVTPMENTQGLPKHYEGISLSLFQIKVD